VSSTKDVCLFPASLGFDTFMSRLNEVGRLDVGDDGRFCFPYVVMSSFEKLYVKCVKDIVASMSAIANHVVYIDECLPQNCSFHRPFPSWFTPEQSNVLRWTVSDKIALPIDDINHMMLNVTKKALGRSKKVVYVANRTVCERYITDGIRSVIRPRLANPNITYRSAQWRRLSDVPKDYMSECRPDEPFAQRNETLEYLWSRLAS
jgi:hypothetical protein